ncbi:MAG TPA: ABC transporter ATP-binding protein [Pseudomonadales bacterium]|nr:ABC transporter ATP-binding protein [Pseudomonadales bacterium]
MSEARFQVNLPGDPDVEDTPRITGRRILELAAKTWPFLRPLKMHLIFYLILIGLSGLVGTVAYTQGLDLLSNKVLVGEEKLLPLQASLLWLEDSFGDAGAGLEVPTDEQRKIVLDRLLIWMAILLVVGIGSFIAIWYWGTWIWHSVNQSLRVAMVERSQHLSLRHHSDTRVGDTVFRVYQDSAQIINLIQEGLIGPMGLLFGLIWAIVLIVLLAPSLLLALLIVVVPTVWLTIAFTPRIRRRALANRVANSDLTSRLQETFVAAKIIKANRAEDGALQRFDKDSHRALDAAFRVRLEMIVLSLLVMMMGGLCVISTEYVMASWSNERLGLNVPAVMAFLVPFVAWNLGAFQFGRDQTGGAIGQGYGAVRMWSQLQDLFIALERAFFILDLEPEVESPDNPEPFPVEVERLEWRGVDFAYEPSHPVLASLDLVADVGTITAIVGATGSGKSTLMSMLLRLYDPDQGAVSINGVDLKRLSVEDVRANTAIALQKNVLFTGSVADNIGYAIPNIDRDRIVEAAKIACADEFIDELDRGYDTELGERGVKLSTGQRQRLSIARAVVRDTPILILDEPTASLDAVNEKRVLANLELWGSQRVVFVITHRLSTIREADTIAFLEDGRIAELGSHDELMSREDGRYRRFVRAETSGLAEAMRDE